MRVSVSEAQQNFEVFFASAMNGEEVLIEKDGSVIRMEAVLSDEEVVVQESKPKIWTAADFTD